MKFQKDTHTTRDATECGHWTCPVGESQRERLRPVAALATTHSTSALLAARVHVVLPQLPALHRVAVQALILRHAGPDQESILAGRTHLDRHTNNTTTVTSSSSSTTSTAFFGEDN